MPATFDEFGIQFMYPDNWLLQGVESDEESDSVTLEMPRGGFFSVTKYRQAAELDDVLDRATAIMREEYPELECEPADVEEGDGDARELRFYYLDLLIMVRLTAMNVAGDTLLVQAQAESREFDASEPVFAAMMHSLRQANS